MLKKLGDKIALYNLEQKYGKVCFYQGNYLEQVEKILSEVCPCGKIATLFFNSSFLKIGKDYTDKLTAKGFKPINVIIPDNFVDSIEDYSSLFTIPEDVRIIITFDERLNCAVKYFGSVRGVDAVHVLDQAIHTDFLSPKITIKNDNALETLSLECNQHVIIDKQFCIIDVPKIYAYVASKIVNLIDYKIYSKLHSKRLIKASYDLLSESIDNALTAFNLAQDKQLEHLLESMFTVEIANRYSGGEIYQTSSENTVKLLMGKFDGYDRIVFLKIALNLYKKYFSGNYEHILEVPDYNARVKDLSEILTVDEKKLMQNLLSQLETLQNSTDKIIQLKKSLLDQVIKAEKLIKQISSTYHALGGGGKENKLLRKCIFFAGDINSTLNGMSLVRESGILEYIQV